MNKYEATATREGKWWVIEVPGVGVTQARNLTEAHTMVDDLIEAMTGEAQEGTSIAVRVSGVLVDRAKKAQSRMADAEKELVLAGREIREVVSQLRAAGLTQQDAASAIGVSRQRVQQLAKEQTRRVRTSKKALAKQDT